MAPKQTQQRRYELAEGLTSVRVGSHVVDGSGLVVDDPAAIRHLDECEHLVGSDVKPKAEKKPDEPEPKA